MRVFDLKTLLQRTATVLFTVMLLVLAACSEDEPSVSPVTVSFPSNGPIVVGEADGEKIISLVLSEAAKQDGTITISATNPTFVTFSPEISVTKGNTVAQFRYTPVNNSTIDGAKSVTFTLASVSSGFEIIDPKTYVVNITDDEGPTTANFALGTGSVSEGSTEEGIEIDIALSSAADAIGTIEISFTPLTEGVFTSSPVVASEKISVPVAVNATEAHFTIKPVENETTGDAVITFTIANATGGVVKGTNVTYVLTISDNDGIELKTIAEVRELFTGTTATITQNYKIKGVITSSNANVTAKNAYIQDASGAVQLRFAEDNTLVRGDEVEVLLKDVSIGLNSGLLQLGGSAGMANAKATKVGTAALPEYQTVTVEELLTGDYESQLVTLNSVSFAGADGFSTLNGNKTISNGTTTTVVRTESYAPWKDAPAPVGTGTVKGIAGIFNTAVQVTPQVAEDIFANNATGVIGVTQTLTDFGSVESGVESAPQSYTVQGTTLTGDVTITATAGFKVSLTTGGTYESSIVIPAASANSATPVFVKFIPTTGSDQDIEGSIRHVSAGAVGVEFDVTGEETGNGEVALETIALWTFETSPYGSSTPNKTGTESDPLTAESGTQSSVSIAKGVHVSASSVYVSPVGNASTKAFSSNNWAIDDYYQFTLNTTGYEDIKVSWDQTRSSTGPENFKLQYSTDGINFTDAGSSYVVIASTGSNITFTDGTTGAGWTSAKTANNTSYSYDLSAITALNNASTVVFRITCVSAPGGTGGTNRVDNVKIEGR